MYVSVAQNYAMVLVLNTLLHRLRQSYLLLIVIKHKLIVVKFDYQPSEIRAGRADPGK